MSEKKVIMYESAEAASLKTVTGWVSRDGHFYGNNEHLARWSGCTHQTCECGNIFEKHRTRCDSCHAKLRDEKYYSLPMEQWDGSTPICLWDDDKFFFDDGEFLDYLADLKSDEPDCEHEVQAVLCTPGKLGLVDESNWADDLPEDGELPDSVAQKVAELNETIKATPAVCWWPGKVRIDVDAMWKLLDKGSDR